MLGNKMFSLLGTSWPPQEAIITSTWPPFFQFNKRLLRQKTGGACLYMPNDGHWLASFEVLPPPPKKGKFFRGQKNLNSPVGSENMMRTPTFEKKNLRPKKSFSSFFGCFCRKLFHADVDSCEQQAILLKKWKFSGQNCVFPARFFRRKIGTILSRRSRLSRASRAPSRLNRPRPIDCGAGPKR